MPGKNLKTSILRGMMMNALSMTQKIFSLIVRYLRAICKVIKSALQDLDKVDFSVCKSYQMSFINLEVVLFHEGHLLSDFNEG